MLIIFCQIHTASLIVNNVKFIDNISLLEHITYFISAVVMLCYLNDDAIKCLLKLAPHSKKMRIANEMYNTTGISKEKQHNKFSIRTSKPRTKYGDV